MKLVIDILDNYVERVKNDFDNIKMGSILATACVASIKEGKSIDELIEKINGMDFDFGDYYDHTETIQNMVIKVIKEYCEVTK